MLSRSSGAKDCASNTNRRSLKLKLYNILVSYELGCFLFGFLSREQNGAREEIGREIQTRRNEQKLVRLQYFNENDKMNDQTLLHY